MKSLESILKEIKKGMTRTRLLTYITNISSFHRIQGTKYLVDAGNYIKDVLEDFNLYVEVLDYSYRDPHPWLPPLIGWWVRDGEVHLLDKEEKILSSFSHASTAIVAHSPPGYFEGRVTYVGREWRLFFWTVAGSLSIWRLSRKVLKRSSFSGGMLQLMLFPI